MNALCHECHQAIEERATRCPACGAVVDEAVEPHIDLRQVDGQDADLEVAELLAAVMAAGDEPALRRRPPIGLASLSLLELELAPVRIGRAPSPDDVLPAVVAPRRFGRPRR
jgi:hypothetical protein